MYAIIQTGGKQYRVNQGQRLKVELLEAEQGSQVEFPQVLLVLDGDKINVGAPFIKGAKVKAEVVRHGRHHKIEIIKFRRRKHFMKHQGHRQHFTEIKITGIETK